MISRLRLIASPAEVFMSSRRIHRGIDYIRVYAFITESGGKLCLHAVTWMIGIVVARRLFEERTEIFMRYAYNIVYGICNGKSRKSDVINSCAHTYIYYIYIYIIHLVSFLFDRKLHGEPWTKTRIIVFRQTRTCHVHTMCYYVPCIRRYVSEKTARPEEEKNRTTIRVHARRDCTCMCRVWCARVCHSFREQLATAVYGIRRVNIDTEGGLAARRERSVSMLHAIKVIHFSACVTRYRVACSQHRSAANVR